MADSLNNKQEDAASSDENLTNDAALNRDIIDKKAHDLTLSLRNAKILAYVCVVSIFITLASPSFGFYIAFLLPWLAAANIYKYESIEVVGDINPSILNWLILTFFAGFLMVLVQSRGDGYLLNSYMLHIETINKPFGLPTIDALNILFGLPLFIVTILVMNKKSKILLFCAYIPCSYFADMAYGSGIVYKINTDMDKSQPRKFQSTVLSKRKESQNIRGSVDYYIDLDAWGAVSVTQDIFSSFMVSEPVCIFIYSGRLNLSWYKFKHGSCN